MSHEEAVRELTTRRQEIEALKEEARRAKEAANMAAAGGRGGARQYRGTGEEESKEMDESVIASFHKERMLDAKTFSNDFVDSSLLFSNLDNLPELLTRLNQFCQEKGLKMNLHETKAKATISTPAAEGEEDMFKDQENEFSIKISKNADKAQLALEVTHLSGTTIAFKESLLTLKKEFADILE